MDLAQINRWRNLASKAGAAFCFLALLVLVDGLLVHFREPANLVKVLPGMTVEINGELTDEAKTIAELTYESSSDQLQVKFEAIHKGYFLGGDMWRGRLLVGDAISPGEYHLAVFPMRSVSPRKAPAFRVVVFPEALSLQKSSTSLIRRFFGISAFAVAAGCLPGIILGFGAVFFLSGKREALMAAAGQAEIYRVFRGENGCEIRFALGTAQGMGPGVIVRIFDTRGQQVGTAAIAECSQTDSTALTAADQGIKAGYLVSRS